MNTQEILRETGLDFNISKRMLSDVQFDANGQHLITESGFYGLFNDTKNVCLATVKKDYRVSQNEEIIELVKQGIGKFDVDISIQKGGAINDGKRVFLQLKIEGDGNVNGDKIVQYLTVTDSNDGTTSLRVGFGDMTMSCHNQFYKFHKMGTSNLRHSASMEEKMLELPKLMEISLQNTYKQIELYNKLDQNSIHKDLAHQLVKDLLGFDRKLTPKEEINLLSTRSLNKMNKLYDCIDTEMGSKGETLWGLHSGITRFTTHELSKPKRDNGDMESLMFGSGYKLNEKSLSFCEGLLV